MSRLIEAGLPGESAAIICLVRPSRVLAPASAGRSTNTSLTVGGVIISTAHPHNALVRQRLQVLHVQLERIISRVILSGEHLLLEQRRDKLRHPRRAGPRARRHRPTSTTSSGTVPRPGGRVMATLPYPQSFWVDRHRKPTARRQQAAVPLPVHLPHANSLGVLSVSLRRWPLRPDSADISAPRLAAFRSSERIVRDGRHVCRCAASARCSTSPKILTSLRALFPTVESATIRAAIPERYRTLFEAVPCLPNRVSSCPSGIRKEREKRKSDREAGGKRSFIRLMARCPSPAPAGAFAARLPDVDVEAGNQPSVTGGPRKTSLCATGCAFADVAVNAVLPPLA